MDSDVVKTFNKALVSMQEAKSGLVNKQKVVEITKAAMNAVRYFKHVVFILERYLAKCRQEYKLSALYVIDSILRQAKKQYKHKDVFGPRFAVNLSNTINNVLDCESSERLKVVRIINLWQAHQIFTDELIAPILQHCQASGLEINPDRVEHLVKGDKADMQLYHQKTEAEKPAAHLPIIPTTPTQTIPLPPMGMSGKGVGNGSQKSLDERLSQFSRQKLGFGRSNSITTTPKTAESGPKTPPLEDQDHRVSLEQLPVYGGDQVPSTGLNGPEVVQLLSKIGIQLTASEAVQKIQALFNERIQEQLDIERRRQGNIKNLLSRDFDYSDEEEDDRNQSTNNGTASASSPTLSNIPREKLLSIAGQLIADPTFSNEIRNVIVNPSGVIQSPVKAQQLPLKFVMPDFSVPPPNLLPAFAQNTLIPQPPQIALPIHQQREEPDIRYHEQRDHHRDRDRREGRGGDNISGASRKRTKEWSPVDSKDSRHSRRREDERNFGRRRSRSRSARRSPQRTNEREREKEKTEKDRELERERRHMGLPSKPKSDHLLIASRTIWFGRIPAIASEQDIVEAVKEIGIPEKVTIVGNRGCAYVTMANRKQAFKIMDRMANKIQVAKKNVKIDWATITGVKDDPKLTDYLEIKKGWCEIPYKKLPDGNVDKLLEGAWLDLETLPAHLKDRYTNTGLKEQFQPNIAPMPQNIALPPMPVHQAMPQILPAMFNQATLNALLPHMQMAAATGLPFPSLPPPGTTVAQIQTAPPHFSALFQTPQTTSTSQQPPINMGTSSTDGFSNAGFAGFNSGNRGPSSAFRPRGGRGGRGGNFGALSDSRSADRHQYTSIGGGYRGGRGGGGYRENLRGTDYHSRGGRSLGGRGNYQKFGERFSSFTQSQQSESEGNDFNGNNTRAVPTGSEKQQGFIADNQGASNAGFEEANKNQMEKNALEQRQQNTNSPTGSDAPPGLD